MFLKLFILVSSGILLISAGKPSKNKIFSNCGYESCPKVKDDMLNVHLVPHTHDDVGWLKTVDQYYYGSKSNIQNAGVQYILDSVIQELLHDPTKRFIYVETAYLWKWWNEQGDHLRHQVKNLVNNGQLEIIGGGWVMNDEAVTHYQSTIDQFTWGFRKISDTFGDCGRPKIGWQIDPFGHSRETASIMANLGFDGLFLGRIDYQDKDMRLFNKTPEFIWQASENLGKKSWLFTHILYHNYSPPPGFCFDILCEEEPFIDNKKSPDYNVDIKVTNFLNFVHNQSSHYPTNNIILTMGEDFQYQSAHVWYKNMDKLIRYVNAEQSKGSKVNVFYSTPSCYLKSVHDTSNSKSLSWSTKQDDFFPYPSDGNSYWTGFFTSRPSLKYYERLGNNFLQVCKQLYALADLESLDWADLNGMREAMGVMQHHDAITGTEQQHVANDYARQLHLGFNECHNTAEISLNKLMKMKKDTPSIDMEGCLRLNISECATSEKNDKFVVTVYNPLAHVVTHYIRLPVSQSHYKVYDNNGTDTMTQFVPIPDSVKNIPGRNSDAVQELVFKAENLPPLGFRTYFVEKMPGSTFLPQSVSGPEQYTIKNNRIKLEIDETSGHIKKIFIDGKDNTVDQGFYYYESAVGNNEIPENRSSGAYIFRPKSQEAISLGKATTTTIKGDLVQELHQKYSDWVSQVIRIYNDDQISLELQWLIGPIPIDDGVGKEIISRFSTDWDTNKIFYTDSNGREILKRVRNWRPTWKVNISEPVSGNYYPVTTTISIKQNDSVLAVLPDRAQGGSSIKDGEIELMIHRRTLHDDAFGVGEALNETQYNKGLVARGKHIVILGSTSNASPSITTQQRKMVTSKLVMAPWVLLAPMTITRQQWMGTYVTEYSGLSMPLPENVHLLTFEPWKADTVLIRLEHFLELKDDSKLSKPTTVYLQDMLSGFTIITASETTLGANQLIKDNKRFTWPVDTDIDSNDIPNNEDNNKGDTPNPKNKFAVELKPMEIRTFIVQFKPKEI